MDKERSHWRLVFIYAYVSRTQLSAVLGVTWCVLCRAEQKVVGLGKQTRTKTKAKDGLLTWDSSRVGNLRLFVDAHACVCVVWYRGLTVGHRRLDSRCCFSTWCLRRRFAVGDCDPPRTFLAGQQFHVDLDHLHVAQGTYRACLEVLLGHLHDVELVVNRLWATRWRSRQAVGLEAQVVRFVLAERVGQVAGQVQPVGSQVRSCAPSLHGPNFHGCAVQSWVSCAVQSLAS